MSLPSHVHRSGRRCAASRRRRERRHFESVPLRGVRSDSARGGCEAVLLQHPMRSPKRRVRHTAASCLCCRVHTANAAILRATVPGCGRLERHAAAREEPKAVGCAPDRSHSSGRGTNSVARSGPVGSSPPSAMASADDASFRTSPSRGASFGELFGAHISGRDLMQAPKVAAADEASRSMQQRPGFSPSLLSAAPSSTAGAGRPADAL